MPNTDFGPVDIRQGNQAEFATEFTDTSNVAVSVSSAEVTLVYTSITGSSITEIVDLALSGGVWTATWSSTSAAVGLVSWSIIAAGSTSSVQNGQIRIYDP